MAIIPKAKASRKARGFYDKGFDAMERGNLAIACDMFLNALELEPGFLEARRFLRAAALKQFRDRTKNGEMAHTLSSIGGAPALIMARGKLGKKPLEALQAAERLLVKDPLNPGFAFLLCDAAEALNMPEIAVQCLEILRDHRPQDLKVLYRLADAYKANGQMADAREVLRRLVQRKPDDQALLKDYKDTTALATMQDGGWGKAGSYRDVSTDDQQAARLEQEGRIVRSGSDLEGMAESLRRKCESEPDNLNYRRALADALVKAGRLGEAQDVLRQAQQLTGGGDPQLDRAMSQIRLRMLDAELEALRAQGDDAGCRAKEQEREDFLLADAEERVRRYPNDREFNYAYGVLLYHRGRVDEAIQQFQAAQRSPKRRASSLHYLGLCFKSKNLFDLAADQLNAAANQMQVMSGAKKDILYELGQVAEAMGQADEARARYKEIYAVDIGYKDVARKIEQWIGPA